MKCTKCNDGHLFPSGDDCNYCDGTGNIDDDFEFDEFECCNDCDLPDACSDFGCAIKQGIRKPPIGYKEIF